MSLSRQRGEYDHTPHPSALQDTPPPVKSTRTLMCAKCGDPLDGHDMFGECFPHDEYLRESSVLLHQGHLIAV